MRIQSGITWFDDDDFINSTVSFPSESTWKLERKLQENEYYIPKDTAQIDGLGSEARAVFIGSKLSGDGPQEAIIKIRMQIPWMGTVTKKPLIRAKQATPEMIAQSKMEVETLSILTNAHCSCTPALFSWVKKQQGNDQWVPGGYILYILMEKLPGVNPAPIYDHMTRQERDDLRAAFKAAWLECVACGVVHGDPAIRNLLWDRATKKCYLIDFEVYRRPTQRSIWRNHLYITWNLAQADFDADQDDMCTWQL
ncbi:hypothetical protein VTN02DRAFT_6464 [Thermoascus thermophilus]